MPIFPTAVWNYALWSTVYSRFRSCCLWDRPSYSRGSEVDARLPDLWLAPLADDQGGPLLGHEFFSFIVLVDLDHARAAGRLFGNYLCKSQLWHQL